MTQLNQLVAVEKGVKAGAERALTAAYQAVQKPALLSGIARNYTPRDDEGDQLPPESTLVQMKVDNVLVGVADELTRLFDVTLTKDFANTRANADVKLVDGTVLLCDVPVTYLLFLEKQLVNLRTFVSKLPVLDPSEVWHYDPTTSSYATSPAQTTRTKKVLRNHVRAEATDKHPAQVDVFNEDVIVGTWSTIKFSGAVPADRVATLTKRVDALIEAVKFAREAANTTNVTDVKAGKAVFDYLFEA